MSKTFVSQLAQKLLPSFLLFVGIWSNAIGAATPIIKRVPVDHVYSPRGFDSNDNIEIIVSGHLPNLCHKNPMSTSKVVGNTIKIELTSLYYEESNPFCPTVQLPFLQPVQVGVLPKGRYKVEVNGGTMVAQNSSISISDPTTTATDEHVYAEVYFVETLPGKDYVNIKGYNPSDCFSFDHMEWFSNGNDVYSILPIMKLLRNDCPMKMVPFEYKFKVPKQLSAKEVLLHVRGMRGNSVNALYQTEQPL